MRRPAQRRLWRAAPALALLAATARAWPGPEAGTVYFSDYAGGSIKSTSGTSIQTVRTGLNKPEALEFDMQGCGMFYSSGSAKDVAIFRERFDTASEPRLELARHTHATLDQPIKSIRFDPDRNHLYYLVRSSEATVYRLDFGAGTSTSVDLHNATEDSMDVDLTATPPRVYYITDRNIRYKVFAEGGADGIYYGGDLAWTPSGVVVDAGGGVLYFSDKDLSMPHIVRVSLADNSTASVFVPSLIGPSALSIDVSSGLLYALSKENTTTTMHAYSLTDGKQAWNVTIPGPFGARGTAAFDRLRMGSSCFTSTTTTTTTTASTTTSTTTTATTSTTTSSTSSMTTTTSTTTTRTTSTRTTTTTTSATITTTSTTATTTTSTSLTSTSTTLTTTSSTRTTTSGVIWISWFQGSFFLGAADPGALVAQFVADRAVRLALEFGIHGALPGTTPDMMQVVDVVSVNASSGGRRLQASVECVFDLRIPLEVSVANNITAEGIAGRPLVLLASINKAINRSTALPAFGSLDIPSPPTLELVLSMTTTSTTLTTTTTTTTPIGNVIRMAGSVLLQVAGVAYDEVTEGEVRSAVAGALGTVFDLAPERLYVALVRAEAFTANYVAKATPIAAFEMVNRTRKEDFVEGLRALIAEALENVTASASSVVVRAAAPELLDLGAWLGEPCGSFTCTPGRGPRSWAPQRLCAEAMACYEVDALCCEDVVPPQLAGPEEAAKAASAVLGACVLAVACVAVTCCAACVVFRRRKAPPAAPAEVAAEGGKSDVAIVTELLAELAGDWVIGDEDSAEDLIEVVLDEKGWATFDGQGFDRERCIPSATGVFRATGARAGWSLDMARSTIATLEWVDPAPGSDLKVSWRRRWRLEDFNDGDIVEWISSGGAAPKGSRGAIAGVFDRRLQVWYDGEAHEASPSDVRLVLRPGGEATADGALPTLAILVGMRRLQELAQEVTRENTKLSSQNSDLHRDVTHLYGDIERENTAISKDNERLRVQMSFADEIRKELTSALHVNRANSTLAVENERLKAQLHHVDHVGRELTQLQQAQQSPAMRNLRSGSSETTSVLNPAPMHVFAAGLPAPTSQPLVSLAHLDDDGFVPADDDSDDTDEEFLAI